MNSPEPDKNDRFIAYLRSLLSSPSDMAALRRGLGKPPGTAVSMHKFVVPWTNGHWTDDNLYLVASLFAAWHQGKSESATESPRNFGASLARLRGDSDSSEKRFIALLDSNVEDLPSRWRHAVSLLKSRNVAINWTELIRHLNAWNSEKRWVQREWAKGFWCADPNSYQES